VATGSNSTAIGPNASAAVANGVALGSGAQVTAASGVALGSGSIATDGNVSVGNAATSTFRRVENVADATAGHDALNLQQVQNGSLNVSFNTLNTVGNATIGGALTVTGPTTLNGGLAVNGPSTLNGNQVVNGNSTINDNQT